MQTHEWEELLYEAPADHLPGKRAVAEVVRLRRALEELRDDYRTRCGHIAYHLTDHTTRTCHQCEHVWGEH